MAAEASRSESLRALLQRLVTADGLLARLWEQLKSPVLWVIGALAIFAPREVVGLFFPITFWGVAGCLLVVGGWVWSRIRWGRRWCADGLAVGLLFLVGCIQFLILLNSEETIYVLPTSEESLFSGNSAAEYDFFGRQVLLLPVPDQLKQHWALAGARASKSVIYLHQSVDAGEAIYNHPVETALAQANDPSRDQLWKVIEIPRLVRTRAGVVDVSRRPARVLVNPTVAVKSLQLWSPGHGFRTGLFATRQGNLDTTELAHRIVFQFELFSALSDRPVDHIVAGVDKEARRQGTEDMMAQALAIRLLLVKDLASGDFYAPDLMLELNRAVRLARVREWSSGQTWFPTLVRAMQAVDADIRSGGAASLGGPIDPRTPPRAAISPFNAAIAELEPTWLKADAVEDEKRTQSVIQQFAIGRRDPTTLFRQLDGILHERIEGEFGDRTFARLLWQLPYDQFKERVTSWLSGNEVKKLYRTLVLRNLGEEHVGLMFSGLFLRKGPSQSYEIRAALADTRRKQDFLSELLPVSIRALYPNENSSATILERSQAILDLSFCRETLSEQDCASMAEATMLEMIRFSVGQEGSTIESFFRMEVDDDFDPNLLMQSIIRELTATAPRHSLAAIDRVFAIYQLRVIHDEAPDLVNTTLFGEGCNSASELSARMLQDDELLREASKHRALLALEGVCGGIDFRSHQRFLESVMSGEGLYL